MNRHRVVGRCLMCGRELTADQSIVLGVGPDCHKKLVRRQQYEAPNDAYTLPFDGDIKCQRVGDRKRYNFAQIKVVHSPTGMEWGYEGSGPSDFAINALLRLTGEPRIAMNNAIYMEFKKVFVATLPAEGGTIKAEAVRVWLNERFPGALTRNCK